MTWTTLPTGTFRSMALHVLPDDRAVDMARQSGSVRRDNLDEKRQPFFGMIDAGAAFAKL